MRFVGDTLLIDARCVLCNRWAKFLRRRLKRNSDFTILGQDAEEGVALIKDFPAALQSMDTVYLVRNGRTYVRSGAAIRVLLSMRWYYAMLFPLAWLVPLPLRDGAYWAVAKLRHRFGRLDD